jgi:hypothetical protein
MTTHNIQNSEIVDLNYNSDTFRLDVDVLPFSRNQARNLNHQKSTTLVGQGYQNNSQRSKARNIHRRKILAARERRENWNTWSRQWAASNYPRPNEFLTVCLSAVELDSWIAKGGTIGSFRKTILDELRSFVVQDGHPWLAMYVTEVRNGPHFHAMFWLPEIAELRDRIAKWIITRFGSVRRSSARNLFDNLRPGRRDVSMPVQLVPISDNRRRQGTDLTGFSGLVDYLGKSIEKNSIRNRGGRPIGKLIGRSLALSRINNNILSTEGEFSHE